MRTLAALRSSGGLWFLPVLFALGTIMPASGYLPHSGYDVADISAAGIAIAYSGPLLAGFTAFWFRGRATFHRPMRTTRHGASVLLAGGWPLLVAGPIVGAVAVLVTARTLPTDGVAWQLLGVFVAVLAACALLGALAAWALPAVVAVPVSTMACFAWINYLPATDSPLLHHMSPTIDGFATTARPASSGLVAVLVLSAVLATGTLLCLGRRTWDRTPRVLTVPLLLVVSGVAVLLSAGSLQGASASLNLTVTETRTTPLTCSTDAGVEVCLWPEMTERASDVAAGVESVNAVLRRWDQDEITHVGQGAGRSPEALDFRGDGLSETTTMLTLALGYVELSRSPCESGGGEAVAELVAVLARASGIPTSELTGEFSHDTLEAADDVLADEDPAIGAWFTERLEQVRCSPTS